MAKQLVLIPGQPEQHVLRELPDVDLPMNRARRLGAEVLSTPELLALFLDQAEGFEMAVELLSVCGGLAGLVRAPEQQLCRVAGVGPKTAFRLKATLELARRLMMPAEGDAYKVTSPKSAADLLMPDMRYLLQEELRVVLLNTRNRVLNVVTIYRGSLNASMVRIAEVFRPAIESSAAAVVVAHNHPSGDPSPSPEDVAVTREMVRVGELLSINVLDHLVIGDGRYVSLKERGLGFDRP